MQLISTEGEAVSENLTGWSVTSVTPKEIKIGLTFAKPLEVSQGEEHDSLAIFGDFSQFKDSDGLSLPAFEFFEKKLPP